VPSIDARITKIELDANTGWYRIHTDDERIVRVETKRRDLAEDADKIRESRLPARIEFTEREGNVNPHTQRPYINRYFEKATPLGDATPPSGIEVVQQTGRKTDPGDAWRICLAAGGKLAVATMPMMPVTQRDFGTQKQIAIAWAEFFFFSTAPAQPSLNGAGVNSSQFQRPADAEPSNGPGAYSDAPPPRSDDDIPF
jgi:hypothetical protein